MEGHQPLHPVPLLASLPLGAWRRGRVVEVNAVRLKRIKPRREAITLKGARCSMSAAKHTAKLCGYHDPGLAAVRLARDAAWRLSSRHYALPGRQASRFPAGAGVIS